ncbi:MAG TPA: hypothetical protein VH210_11275 [Gaiellaceae bacterium]|nr:hypothetical protein [Gaiellaceae bacterium]
MTMLEELVSSLLYEGYALYPYTSGSAKNATPTPFGIVYPPAYAGDSRARFDHLRLVCELAEPGLVTAEVRFLQSVGDTHSAVERRVRLAEPGEQTFAFGDLKARARLECEEHLVTVCVHNLTDVAEGVGRTEALEASLISTHVVVRAIEWRFVSPLESGCTSVNTYPVLATPEDDVVVGAAIVLPDHPQLAAASRGSLFDATEIEEALLLHVRALSDGEREAIAAGDPKVAEMIERAATATQEDIMRLHGLMQPTEPETRGEDETTVGGVTVRRGAKLVLRPRAGADAQDFLLDGRTATLERIYVDYDDAVHLAVTIDSDPMQQVLRESGRCLFFKPDEVEVTA